MQLHLKYVLLGIGCHTKKNVSTPEILTIGVVSYSEGVGSLDKQNRFKDYIPARTKSIRTEVEPAYNELQAITQIKGKKWDIVFATSSLAAIAISQELYVPIFSMESSSRRQRSLIVVRNDSSIQKVSDLANRTIALGKPGSASGYYLPLYDFYGLTLAQMRSAPTTKRVAPKFYNYISMPLSM